MTAIAPHRVIQTALTLFLFFGSGSRSFHELQGQEAATAVVEENIRAEPQGIVLGRILPGASFSVLSLDDQWVEIEMEGWIWARSIQDTDRLGFDLRVSVSPRENLRSEPTGTILGRLVEGTLLNREEEVTGWVRVRRAVWIWRESVELEAGTSEPGRQSNLSQGGGATSFEPRGDSPWWRTRETGEALLSAPDGDTLALPEPGTEMRILAREGNWIRVRLEGWVWAPEAGGVEPSEGSEPAEATPSQVASDPDRYRGRTFSWELQFVSLERAEKIRTDFYEGEPFLLTRVPGSPGLFVYVAVPPDQVSQLDGLIPLERILVVGRLRTGAAALTGNPILDLMEIVRIQDVGG